MTIIKTTNGCVFGGFTAQLWSGHETKIDADAFVFSLINKENAPIRINCLPNRKAIHCVPTFGPVFGMGDIFLYSNSNTRNNNYTRLCSSYMHPEYNKEDSEKAKAFFTGEATFQTIEIEVFQKIK